MRSAKYVAHSQALRCALSLPDGVTTIENRLDATFVCEL